MPQTVDVTGLPPDAVKAVEALVETLREHPAAASSLTGAPPQLPHEEWLKWLRGWVESHPRRDIVIDDDRESIYDRSCE